MAKADYGIKLQKGDLLKVTELSATIAAINREFGSVEECVRLAKIGKEYTKPETSVVIHRPIPPTQEDSNGK